MNRLTTVIACVVLVLGLVAAVLRAQTPIVIGPASRLLWEVQTPSPQFAGGLTYVATFPGPPQIVQPLVGVSCIAKDATTQTCSVLAQTLPLGSRSMNLTASDGTVTSGPSVTFAYIDLVIPIPSGLRFQP